MAQFGDELKALGLKALGRGRSIWFRQWTASTADTGCRDGQGGDRNAGAARRARQGARRISRRCDRRGDPGGDRGGTDESADRPARGTVAADAGRSRAMSDLHWLTATE